MEDQEEEEKEKEEEEEEEKQWKITRIALIAGVLSLREQNIQISFLLCNVGTDFEFFLGSSFDVIPIKQKEVFTQ